MVCYGGGGNITYSAAREIGKVQKEVLTELCANITEAEQVCYHHEHAHS